jgi:hypothetical protein
MKIPFGPKGLIALGAVLGAVALWKVRSQRRERDAREWEAEISGAIDEGRTAAEPSRAGSSQ